MLNFSQHFKKKVDEKILATVQKIINKKIKSQSAWVFGRLEYVKRAVLGFVVFIVRLLIHPSGR
jgi:transcription termination factor NusB